MNIDKQHGGAALWTNADANQWVCYGTEKRNNVYDGLK